MRMSLSRHVGLLVGSLTTIGLLTAARSAVPDVSAESARAAEVARVQTHLEGAERVLLAADNSHLTSRQRAARERNIGLLRAYRERGVFPRNIDFPGRREPYFVDDRGVRCAMAYLVAASGRTDIVERIRATRNNARIRELADDTALIAWLDEAGLTAAEAARIQPAYDGICVACVVTPERTSRDYVTRTAVSSVFTGAGIALNLASGRGEIRPLWRSALALAAGTAGMALGVPRLGSDDEARKYAVWNAATGALSLGLGTYTLVSRGHARGSPSPQADAGARDVSLNVAPFAGATAGVRVNVAF